MEQLDETVNYVIHDAHGQPQIIKVRRTPTTTPVHSQQESVKTYVVSQQDASKLFLKHNLSVRQITPSKQQQQQQNTPETILGLSPIKSPPYKQLAQEMQNTPKFVPIPQTSTTFQSYPRISPANKKKSLSTQTPISRRRKTDRVGKGLRHFSMKVCEKVKEKGKTTYNEVADELVEEEAKGQPINPASYDQKNIRRRVYDALNVLMAMNIISKDKKEIRWIGLPTNSAQQCSALEKERQARKERIEVKQQQLRELILQHVSFKSLVTRNKEAEERGIVPASSSAIQLPFIIVNAHKKTHINCSISNDKSEYFFKFDDKFEIHDDVEVLKRMGLLLGLDKGECTIEDIERAKTMVPKSFEKYVELYGRGEDDTCDEWETEYMDVTDDLTAKSEVISDQEDLDDDHYTDGSDAE